MVKSSIVKKFVTLGVAGAMAISVLGASVASATYYVDGGRWNTFSVHYNASHSYGYSSYYHPTRYHRASVALSNGKVFRAYAGRGSWATVSRHFYGNDALQRIYTYYCTL